MVIKPKPIPVNKYNSNGYKRLNIKEEEKYPSSLLFTFLNDNEDNGPQSPTCCGSTTVNADVIKDKTGSFERKSSGGSFKVCNHNFSCIGLFQYIE